MERVELACEPCRRPIGRDLTMDPHGHPWHDQCYRGRWHPGGPLRAPTALERCAWRLPLVARITLAAIVVIAAIALAATIAQAATRPTYIGCGDGSTTDFVQHPKFCSTLQPSQSLAEAIALHNLHWHSWGGLSATATARTRAKTNEPWTPVTVRVYRRVWSSCADGYVYTRLRTTIQGRHVIWKMLSCA